VGEFLQVPAYPGSPLSTAIKQSRVCVCVRAHTVDGPEALCLLVVLPSVHTCMPMAEAFSEWVAVIF